MFDALDKLDQRVAGWQDIGFTGGVGDFIKYVVPRAILGTILISFLVFIVLW